MILYSVYDADGGHFRMVDEEQALALLDLQAAIIDGKRSRIKLRLTVDHSTARAILMPRYPVRSQGNRTLVTEYVGDSRTYKHHERRCGNWLVIDGETTTFHVKRDVR